METITQTTPQNFLPDDQVAAWPQEESVLYTNAMRRMMLMMEGGVSSPTVEWVSPGQADSGKADTYNFYGRDLIPLGWKKASKQILCGTAAAALMTWTTIQPGVFGNSIKIRQVQAVGTVVDWDPATKIITVGLDIAGGGDTLANIVIALGVSVSGANYVVVADPGAHGAQTANIATSAYLEGGLGQAFQKSFLWTHDAANSDMIWTARKPGVVSTTVAFVADLPGGSLPTVVVLGSDITVHTVAAGDTALNIIDAINASKEARALVSVRLTYDSNGSGKQGASIAQHLAGGADGSAVTVRIGGREGIVTLITDTAIVADVDAVDNSSADDTVVAELTVCGYRHTISMIVI